MAQTTNQNNLTGCTECGAFTNHFEDCPNDLAHPPQLGTVASTAALPASVPNAAENRALLNEYTMWLDAGISPELLKFPTKEVGAMLQAIPAQWRFNEYFIRINNVPVRVDIDVDVAGDFESLQEVCDVKVHGDCPSCFTDRETQDNEYTRECRGYCGEDEFIVCECGREWKLELGIPAEFKEVR